MCDEKRHTVIVTSPWGMVSCVLLFKLQSEVWGMQLRRTWSREADVRANGISSALRSDCLHSGFVRYAKCLIYCRTTTAAALYYVSQRFVSAAEPPIQIAMITGVRACDRGLRL